jgi:hypothetical protein
MDADADGREPTGWMLRVRGRRGEIVPRPGEGIDLNHFYYVEAGPFSVLIPRCFQPGQRGLEKVEEWCWGILASRGGSMETDALYPLTLEELIKLWRIIGEEGHPVE